MNILTAEPMSYKRQIKKTELLTKLRIIKLVKEGGHTQVAVADKFDCHRNTVGKIVRGFEKDLDTKDKDKLLHCSLTMQEITELLAPLKNSRRVPKSNSRSASKRQAEAVVEIFEEQRTSIGPYSMETTLQRMYGKDIPGYENLSSFEKSLGKLKIGSIRGIYKRNDLKKEEKSRKNKEREQLHDYLSLCCFEHLHYDTKEITDKGALPEEVYEKFKLNPDLPIYEYNIIDAKSRFRFLGYSNHLYSEFGLKFLLLVVQFIRAKTNNWEVHITIGADNGTEFCSGSKKKEARWNRYLERLNASFYSYHTGHDIRKNLIERSHRTDDRFFYVPRGRFINSKQDFLREAAEYFLFINAQRHHTGIGMENRTPLEVLKDSKVLGVERLLTFPAMILEDNIETIRKYTDYLILDKELDEYEEPDYMSLQKIRGKYSFFDPKIAQNVLTYHL